MSLLIFTLRRQIIIRLKSDYNLKIMNLKNKLFALQGYASSISDSSISMNDMMKAPASMFGRMSLFMMASHQQAMYGAQQKFNYMSQIPGSMPQMQDANMQEQYKAMMFKSLYDQERDKIRDSEGKKLNAEETKIQQELAELQTKLTRLDSEEEKISSAEEKAAGKSASYVA